MASVADFSGTYITTGRRIKKVAKPGNRNVNAADVVDRLYAHFPMDMAKLAE